MLAYNQPDLPSNPCDLHLTELGERTGLKYYCICGFDTVTLENLIKAMNTKYNSLFHIHPQPALSP